ncbi:MAG TPA: NAD(P)-binding protein, partial [Burkholderiaceae bacterium]
MTRIAILGGGIGALSAAFELTQLDRGGEYEITVYQVGWRLGGKGAVGRDVDLRYRAEEHGLHVWAGFYDNAFALVDKCYDALRKAGRPVPFGSRLDAFTGLDRVTLMQQDAGGWRPWSFELPRRPGTPGDAQPPGYATLLEHVLGLMQFANDHADGLPRRQAVRDMVDSARSLPQRVKDVRPHHRRQLQQEIRGARNGGWLAREAAANAAASGGEAPTTAVDAVLVDLALAMAHGILEDAVFEGGLDALDAQEWTAWMRANGCSEASLDSAVARACYDYVFGFVRGGVPDFGAGTGTRLLLKLLFGYKGSFFYIMRATMGELLFAPLYHALRERGVRFRFFHRVDNLAYSRDENAIERIDMTVQATTQDGLDYDPLIRIRDGVGRGGELDSWPSRPKYEQLREGDELQRRNVDLESAWSEWPADGASRKALVRGKDFDEVVLGISLGAFPSICSELIAAKPAWSAMVQNVKTVPTMALQLWTTCPTSELVGRLADEPQGEVTEPATLVSSFAKPLDTWGDMSLLLAQEEATQPRPQGLHYFVSSFEPTAWVAPGEPGSTGFPAEQLAQ